ncbi:ABC transporter permease [Candidatus Magnetomonas plexicatena]|uniref:ABC transporter permease n=1 Tax=Candidatus Magnetomonas plexicatena TaxID=2552947 RepID=UPI001C784892|nr:FtsX-like permease family protein [Nitrospirales bacterium LBB_01]
MTTLRRRNYTFKNLTLNLKIALKSLSTFKLRTTLAVMGAVFGALSITVVSGVSLSMEIKTERELASFGKNLLIIRSGQMKTHGRPDIMTESPRLSALDAAAIRDHTSYVKETAVVSTKSMPIRYGDTTLPGAVVMGVSVEYFKIRDLKLSSGTLFTQAHDKELQRVVVIGSNIAERFFPTDESPLGKYIYIYQLPCEIIGVAAPMGEDFSDINQDNLVYMPLQTFLRRFTNTTKVNFIQVQAVDSAVMEPLKAETERILKERHSTGEQNDFSVFTLKDLTVMQDKTIRIVKILGLCASAASFSISAIGILSIMALMVTERRTEIGIRRAVGASKRDIVLQFLGESSFISVSGGIAGVLLGTLINAGISYFSELPLKVSATGVMLALICSVLTGIVSGVYPSMRAVRIAPVNIAHN